MQVRGAFDRRRDKFTAERFDLAILTAQAFDLRAAQAYLRLSGIDSLLIDQFSEQYPWKVRAAKTTAYEERRRRHP